MSKLIVTPDATRELEHHKGLTQRVDLHVHTKHSGRFKLFVLNRAAVDECYTEPETLYRRLLERGMTLVTATDHDTIDGCLEIAHHGSHVFLSEEVSARFPENGCIVHVLAYHITEAQHVELQRLRSNVYDLVQYMRAAGIAHSLAHPFSPVNGRLNPVLLKKCFLLFDTIEAINGQKDPGHEAFLRRMMDQVGPIELERWANELGIEPVTLKPTWSITAGSDDHSGLTMARSFTSFEGPCTPEGLTAALRDHRTCVHGHEKTGKSYSHTAFVGTINYFKSGDKATDRTYGQLISMIQSRTLPDEAELSPVLKRLVPAALQTLAEAGRFPDFGRVLKEGHLPEVHDELYDLVSKTLLRAFQGSFGNIREGLERIDLDQIIEEIPTILRLMFLNLPYYFGFRFFSSERRRAAAHYSWLGLDQAPKPARIAIFSDTIDNVDGVAVGLRRLIATLRDEGRDIYLCGAEVRAADAREVEPPGIVRFETLGTFPLIAYDEYTLGWPSLLEVMRWIDEQEIDVVQVSTPGPVGLVAMLACRILGIPVIGHYHTHVGDFARRILGDPAIARLVRAYTAWFYGGLRRVIVPSRACGETLSEMDIRPERIDVLRRGVDATRFRPDLRTSEFWPTHGLRGKNTLLYVGRVSREKSVEFLAKVFRSLVDEGHDLELAVVGDGPWLAAMKAELTGYPVAFTGYLAGDPLATAFASSDLFVFPSTTDTFGNVVAEALASGLVPLVADEGGPPELVTPGVTGFVLPADDLEAWKQAIVATMSDASKRKALGEAARAYACTLDYRGACSELWSYYDRLTTDLRQEYARDVAHELS